MFVDVAALAGDNGWDANAQTVQVQLPAATAEEAKIVTVFVVNHSEARRKISPIH